MLASTGRELRQRKRRDIYDISENHVLGSMAKAVIIDDKEEYMLALSAAVNGMATTDLRHPGMDFAPRPPSEFSAQI